MGKKKEKWLVMRREEAETVLSEGELKASTASTALATDARQGQWCAYLLQKRRKSQSSSSWGVFKYSFILYTTVKSQSYVSWSGGQADWGLLNLLCSVSMIWKWRSGSMTGLTFLAWSVNNMMRCSAPKPRDYIVDPLTEVSFRKGSGSGAQI